MIIYYRRLREYQLYKIYLCVSIYSLYDAICINIYVPQTLYMRSQIVLGMSIMGIQANSLIKQNVIAAESHIPLTQPHSCYKKYVYALNISNKCSRCIVMNLEQQQHNYFWMNIIWKQWDLNFMWQRMLLILNIPYIVPK